LRDAKTNVRNRFPDMIGRPAFRTLGLETAGDDDKADMRIGAGATSPGTFGHGGAGGQIAWADPATGLSFVFLTNTFDANVVRMYRRDAALTRLAARCVR
jgi:CubicO group peptidase (beta-lactamase class C family)